MKFNVYENDIRADRNHIKSLKNDCWANSSFNSPKEALDYVKLWLGMYYSCSKSDSEIYFELGMNNRWDYKYYTDSVISIKVE